MINKTTFLATLLLMTSSLHPMLEMTESDLLKDALSLLSQKQLHAAARKAVTHKKQVSTRLFLQAGAKPPLFTAAKHGDRRIAAKVAKQAALKGLTTTPQKRINILNRLIRTGDLTNLNAYFSNKIVTSADITPKSIAYAQERANIHIPNKHILRYLKKQCRISKKSAKQEREFKFGQIACTICLEDFKKDKVKTLPCDHAFHPHCIKEWFTARGFEQCAVCKKPENKVEEQRIPEEWNEWIDDPGFEGDTESEGEMTLEEQRVALAEFARQRVANRTTAAEGPSN